MIVMWLYHTELEMCAKHSVCYVWSGDGCKWSCFEVSSVWLFEGLCSIAIVVSQGIYVVMLIV